MDAEKIDTEGHITLSPAVRDIIIGLSDGLTVPFAIAAGLASAAAGNTSIIITAVLAEIAAGSISMGLGGYLAADTEAQHYANERRREEREVEEKPDIEKREVAEVFESFGLSESETAPLVESLSKRKKDWVDFMMRFELGLDEPDKLRAIYSALTIGGAYIVGGLIPLTPYLVFRHDIEAAFLWSVVCTLVALLIFGYIRGRLIMERPWRGVIQTVLLGVLAASAAFGLGKLVP